MDVSDNFLNNVSLRARLKQCTNLPSPPGVASEIIALGQDPDVNMTQVAMAISMDPALTAKILRMANSAYYARQRRTDNLRQAIMLFGVHGTLTMALSFSLAKSMSAESGNKLDYPLYWRRSLTAATACRILGSRLKKPCNKDLFLPALLQDIGMMALDKAVPELYRKMPFDQSNHDRVSGYEKETLGADHAAVGAWLLQAWGLPAQVLSAVAGSHDPRRIPTEDEYTVLTRCVAVSGRIADIWWGNDPASASVEAAELAEDLLDIDRDTLALILEKVGTDQRETAQIFEVELGDTAQMESMLDQAKEILMLRNLQILQQAADLKQTTDSLESRTRELEEVSRRDALTGIFNRGHLDSVITEEFQTARTHNWPLTLAYIDLDHFKRINDNHGHPAGDAVLKAAANLLLSGTRDTDFVGRYGGEEFVVVLPGTGLDGARVTVERLMNAFRQFSYTLSDGGNIGVTASIGLVVMEGTQQFDSETSFVEAADKALYQAKHLGRDCYVFSGSADNQPFPPAKFA